MSRIKHRRPSPAILVAVIALVAALGGSAVAEVATTSKLNKKEKKQVKKIAKKQGQKQAKKQVAKQFPVGSSQLADGAVTAPKLADGAVNGAKIAAGSIGDEKLADIDLFGDSFVRATPTAGGEFDAAQAAAPKVPLWSKGQLSAYGKCFSSTDGPETYARVYVETSVAGAILGTTSALAGVPDLDGDSDFLDPGTPESDRRLESVSVGDGSTREKQLSRVSFVAMSPDGTAVDGLASVAVKSGGPNGVYGPGGACLFSGFGIG